MTYSSANLTVVSVILANVRLFDPNGGREKIYPIKLLNSASGLDAKIANSTLPEMNQGVRESKKYS